ncbi:MAG TPA: hypothetical protein VG166_01515 [Caulobacteraceae bacterium]|jgi:hypothetical protein|nr:hypothetical protein [Caulobacteraceae bacterium]
MKTVFATLASALMLSAPLTLTATTASAMSHGGGFHGGGFRGGGFRGGFGGSAGFRGNGIHGRGFRDGGFGHDGFRHDGFRHHRFGDDDFFFDDALFDFDFGSGLAFADDWLYGGPDFYGYPGYGLGTPWPADYGYRPAGEPGDGSEPPMSRAEPRAGAQARPRQACGSWVWDAAQSRYDWAPC